MAACIYFISRGPTLITLAYSKISEKTNYSSGICATQTCGPLTALSILITSFFTLNALCKLLLAVQYSLLDFISNKSMACESYL